ncbi:glycosyltransferase family 2 protein [Candidatus Weimeria sp. HCP3S3_B5]|uniref:glycosyltransferase family 2 protein n=1 Tax=Candidatus Weimeria sp. HCP3S3_B5 TaxID=3438871 RepID=UPI003F8B831D
MENKMELERIRFSIIIGAYETNAVFFRQGLSSACAIKWKNLEIHVLDACPGAGLDEVTRQTAGDDYRVSYHRIRPRGSLADVFNAGIGMARGDYLIFLGLTDRLNTMILRYLSDHIMLHPDDQIIYTDHDEIRDKSRMNPYFLPDFNKELLLGDNYIGDTFIVKRDAFSRTGFFNKNLRFAFDYDLFLRAMAKGIRFGHVAALLWHRMEYDLPDSPEIRELRRQSLREHITVAMTYFNQAGVAASISQGILGDSWEVRYDGSGFEAHRSDVILIKNRHVRVLTRRAAQKLYGYVCQPDIAIAAGKFIHGTHILNCGYIFDQNGITYPACRGQGIFSSGLYGRNIRPQDVSMVDFSFCMIDASFFKRSGGFDTRLKGNDMFLDLCLKARAGGLRVVYVPGVITGRQEAEESGDEASRKILLDKWSGTIPAGDPFYNRNLPAGIDNYVL